MSYLSLKHPVLIASDLEGVLIPEVWLEVARVSGVKALTLTTRDIKVYSELMNHRLKVLKEEKITVGDIQKIIQSMPLLEGAYDFLEKLRSSFPLVILSDTFYQFAAPFMQKLNWPSLFCHQLVCDENGNITGYQLRHPDSKRQAVTHFQDMGFKVIAMGDSYNDSSMLLKAEAGHFFNAPENVLNDFPQFNNTEDYDKLYQSLLELAKEVAG